MRSKRTSAGIVAAAACALLVSATASADTCREWQGEHTKWKVETVRRYLAGAPSEDVEAAVFELLQREAYLTSCETSVSKARNEMIAWRLLDREPEEFGSVVLETVLRDAGFDPDLRSLFEASRIPALPPEPVVATTTLPRSKRTPFRDPRRRATR